jgi:hypothetical protein
MPGQRAEQAGRASQPAPRYGCQAGASIGRDLFDSVAVSTGLRPIVRKIRRRLAAGTTHQDEPIMTRRGVIRRMIFCKSRLHAGLQMTTGERSFKEKLALQIAIRKIDSVFEVCSKFGEKDRKILFEVIRNLLLQHIPHGPGGTPVPADEATPPFTELAITAPTARLPPAQTLKRKPPKPIGIQKTRRRLIVERKSPD